MRVKEAAERLRKAWSGEDSDWFSVYETEGHLCNDELYEEDKKVLAEAYLEEHRPDDDEPIDFNQEPILISQYGPITFLKFYPEIKEIAIGSFRSNNIQTKGQLRRLVELLGGAK